MKRLLFLLPLLFFVLPASFAQQVKDVISWKYDAKKTGDNTFDVIITATIQQGWHIYTATPKGDGSQVPTKVVFNSNPSVKLVGGITNNGKAINEEIKDLDMTIQYYKGTVTYRQKIEATANTQLTGKINFQICNDNTCLPTKPEKFSIKISGLATTAKDTVASATSDTVNTLGATNNDTSESISGSANSGSSNLGKGDKTNNTTANIDAKASSADDTGKVSHSLWGIFFSGLFQGLIAFVTPCIFSMLPITVSFFTKRSKTKAAGLKNATFYALSIVLIFSLIGVLISLFFKEDTMYKISSSVAFNLFVFVIFIVFGISLLGAFEITLPSSWSSKLDSKANTNSFGGIFFMAMVLVVVSFSCTSAFISMLIVDIVQTGNQLGGVIGFFGFGLALALPFALFAYFPGLLNSLAKSGGWLNSVKVTMGFVELGLAMKFLSNVDLQYHWGLLNYDVFLSIWIALALLLGLYLIGVIRFSHDDDLPKNMFGHPYLSVTRLMFAIVSFAFMTYMLPGLWGAPLTGISGLLPERKTLEFNVHDNLIRLQTSRGSGGSGENEIMPVKYTEHLKSELPGITAYFDYHEALEVSKKTGKPILLDFTGHSCINCRKMERTVLSKPQVLKELGEHFVLASLYCDESGDLIPSDVYTNSKGEKITTIGEKNLDIEVNKYGAVGQPTYIFVDSDGNVIKHAGGYVDDVPRFLGIINEVKEKYKKK
jgi:thiol:disulfide interchange protein